MCLKEQGGLCARTPIRPRYRTRGTSPTQCPPQAHTIHQNLLTQPYPGSLPQEAAMFLQVGPTASPQSRSPAALLSPIHGQVRGAVSYSQPCPTQHTQAPSPHSASPRRAPKQEADRNTGTYERRWGATEGKAPVRVQTPPRRLQRKHLAMLSRASVGFSTGLGFVERWGRNSG